MKRLSCLWKSISWTTLASTAMLCGLFAGAQVEAEERVLEEHREVFYDGLVVTAKKLEGGRLVATVTKTWPSGRREPLGRFTLDVERARGEWLAFGTSDPLRAARSFDYARTEAGDDLSNLLRMHTAKSVALSALLLWEESRGEDETMGRVYGQDCASCAATPNGCSGWSDTCNGRSVQTACNRHDVCYQCGSRCDGSTRPQCDAQFRQEVQAATQSADCAQIYWYGVRFMGWLFMRNPETRASSQPDVYSLGIALTGCPSGYTHLCTIYLF